MKPGAVYKALVGWQNYADDEMAENLFYADVSPYAPDELTEEYWPVPVGEQIVPMRLPTDGDERGEFSVWILPVDCALLNGDISSFRLRVTDDVNNWRRSPEFITAIPELEIVEPSGCGETPDDRCQFSPDETIEFEAAMTGVDELLDQTQVQGLIEWYVLDADGQGGWNELDKEAYENSEFESVITQESWTGPSFTVLLKDHEFQVRAELLVCGDILHDDCFVEDPRVIELMFRGDRYPDPSLWDDECHYDYFQYDENEDPPDKRRSAGSPLGWDKGDGYVVDRPTSSEEVHLYALVQGQYESHDLLVSVKAPEDAPEKASIQVFLYELANTDPQLNAILADFGCGEIPVNRYVYGRGADHIYHQGLGIGQLPERIPENIRITEFMASSEGQVAFGTPYLRVSNADEFHDYSRLVANDPPNVPWWLPGALTGARWTKLVGSFWYGEDWYDDEAVDGLRGYFAWDMYNGADGQQNYRNNVLEIGQEVIVAEADRKTAHLPVQSRPDIAFIFAHGGPSEEGSLPPLECPACTRDSWVFDFGDWPIQPGAPAQSAVNITPYELAEACPAGSDTEWLLLYTCDALNDGQYYLDDEPQGVKNGYDDWECIIGSGTTSIKAVCGFKGEPRSYAWAEELADNFTTKLDDYDTEDIRIKEHWDLSYSGGSYPQEKVVIAWMEAAIWYINTWTTDNNGGFVSTACAVSTDGMWILEDTDNELESYYYKARRR